MGSLLFAEYDGVLDLMLLDLLLFAEYDGTLDLSCSLSTMDCWISGCSPSTMEFWIYCRSLSTMDFCNSLLSSEYDGTFGFLVVLWVR